MTESAIDKRLLDDCSLLFDDDGFSYLLHRNAEVWWFILVPNTEQAEFYRLDTDLQHQLCSNINRLSDFIQTHFSIDKINVATIGNVVSQMHIHVIGRRMDDAYWPDVVWGRAFDKTYDQQQIESIAEQLKFYLQNCA